MYLKCAKCSKELLFSSMIKVIDTTFFLLINYLRIHLQATKVKIAFH